MYACFLTAFLALFLFVRVWGVAYPKRCVSVDILCVRLDPWCSSPPLQVSGDVSQTSHRRWSLMERDDLGIPQLQWAQSTNRRQVLLPAGCMYVFVRAELYPVLLVYCQLLTTSPVL